MLVPSAASLSGPEASRAPCRYRRRHPEAGERDVPGALLMPRPPCAAMGRAGKCCLIPVDTLATARGVGPALPGPSLDDTPPAVACLCVFRSYRL